MRPFVRFLTVLLGLLLLAAGVVLLIELVWTASPPLEGTFLLERPPLEAELRTLSWNAPAVRTGAAVTAVLGVLLLLFGLRAGRGDIRLHDPAEGVAVVTGPRSLARVVGHKMREQEGVAKATVVARRKAVRVTAVSEFTEVGDLERRLADTARATIDDLPLVTTPRVSVTVRPTKRR
ncbi:hypothetical protein FHR84_000138 [Actinopolyspora biskrensis]|uniref:DUF6286 domain-containing protein n=1 Tax=Actinopolyspora biskrensis TaxID=1470178 RepID=A0A852YNF7_9ACTN|nr:DUF6286 domain-containing protein [Actinopolyspora biskrensis]NYH76824.1 hypothetical protein [Actinopolyspora biskrensis]